jgi:hypothetical protein
VIEVEATSAPVGSKCAWHPTEAAVLLCQGCGAYCGVCCVRPIDESAYCPVCAQDLYTLRMPSAGVQSPWFPVVVCGLSGLAGLVFGLYMDVSGFYRPAFGFYMGPILSVIAAMVGLMAPQLIHPTPPQQGARKSASVIRFVVLPLLWPFVLGIVGSANRSLSVIVTGPLSFGVGAVVGPVLAWTSISTRVNVVGLLLASILTAWVVRSLWGE